MDDNRIFDPHVADDGWAPSYMELSVATSVLLAWGGLRDKHLATHAIVRRMLVAAHNATLK